MNENLNDFLSTVILLSIPVGMILLSLKKILKRKIEIKKEETGKYYPEW